MPLPTPRTDEKESDFISRCVPDVIESEDLNADDEADRKQATAICYSQWERGMKEQEPAAMFFSLLLHCLRDYGFWGLVFPSPIR